MDDDNDMLALTVSVPAEQWDFARRRLRYMEAVIVQILRDAARFKEWYSAAELAALGLRGLPGTKQGIARLAASQKWRRRIVTGRGGERHEYRLFGKSCGNAA